MAGALILADQTTGAGAGVAGIARIDIYKDRAIDLSCPEPGNTSYRWYLLSTPLGSAAALDTPNNATCSFTPDEVGSYRVRLITNGGGPGNTQTRIYRCRYDSVGALLERGWAMPAIGEEDGESNYGTPENSRSWAEPIESMRDDILALLGVISTLVYKPGGTDADNVYTSWSALMADFALLEGTIEILIDDSVTSPAVIPAGAWDLEDRGVLIGAVQATKTALTIGDGSVTYLQRPSGFKHLLIRNAVGGYIGSPTVAMRFDAEEVTFQSTTGRLILAANGSTIHLRGNSSFTNSVAEVCLELATGAGAVGTVYVEDFSSIATDCLKIFATQTLTVYLSNSVVSCSESQTDNAGTLTVTAPVIPSGTTFVFRPGGVAAGNVYTSWTLLMAAHAAVTGPRVIEFDNSLAECSVPTGAHALGNNTILTGRWFGQGNETRVLLEAGGSFVDPSIIEGGISIYSRSNAVIFSFTSWADGSSAIYLRGNASLSLFTDSVAPTSSLIEVPNGGVLILYLLDSSALLTPVGSIYNIVKMLGTGQVNVHLHGGYLIGNDMGSAAAGDAFDPGGGGGLIDVYFLNDGITYVHTAPAGLTLHRFTCRKLPIPLMKGAVSNALTTPSACGAAYLELAKLPNHANLTCKFRVIIETTNAAAGSEAYIDLYDVHGQLNASVPAVVTGSQIDTGTGSAPTGAPTPNVLIPSLYEVDLTAAIIGGTWVSGIAVFEARVWIGTASGGNAATCKSAELIFEW